MLNRETLSNSLCQAQHGSVCTPRQIEQQLSALPDWRHVDQPAQALPAPALCRTYRFKNYYETLAFVNALAYMVHTQDHHPDLHVQYNQCTVYFNTHSVGGVTLNDFICAAKTDAIFTHASNQLPTHA